MIGVAMSVAVAILATGCSVTKNNIRQDADGYHNTGWQVGTPTIDTHTPGMTFRRPVMMRAPGAGYQEKQPVAPQQKKSSAKKQQLGQGTVVPDVSGICPTGAIQVASSEWSSASSVENLHQQVAEPEQAEPQPQYLMAWEEGASQVAQPGQSVIWHGGVWVGGWGDGYSYGAYPWGERHRYRTIVRYGGHGDYRAWGHQSPPRSRGGAHPANQRPRQHR